MIYGSPILHIDDDQTDRIGIRTVILSQIWQPSRWPMSQGELDAEVPAPPTMSSGMWFIGQQTRRQRGYLRTSWTFEGVNGNGKSVTFKDRDNSPDYSFEPGFSERSIMTLPNIRDLLDEFGGYTVDGQVVWPPTIPNGDKKPNQKKTDEGKPNPLFGCQSFFTMEGVYKFRYAAFSLTAAYNRVGTIFRGGLPGNPPSLTDGRDWLKAPPAWQRRGPVVDITEMYWLSDKEGWPEILYGVNGATTK